MKFEVGKFYKTRDGRKARCVCNDKEGVYPNVFVSGSYAFSTTELGGLFGDRSSESDDIIGPWIDKPVFDFGEWPKWVKYAAMDKNGLWFACKAKPNKAQLGWAQLDHHYILIPREYAPKWDGPWEESLCVRGDE